MPRGNDSAAASQELASRYNTSGNAEDLVQSARLSRNQALASASLQSPNEEETRDLDHDKIASDAGVDEIVSAQVRGDYVVYAWEDESGRLHKGVTAKEGTRAEQRLQEQEQEDQAQSTYARQQAEIAKAAREANEKVAEATREAQEEANQEAAEKVQAIQDEQQSEGQSGESESGSGGESAPASGETGDAPQATQQRRSAKK